MSSSRSPVRGHVDRRAVDHPVAPVGAPHAVRRARARQPVLIASAAATVVVHAGRPKNSTKMPSLACTFWSSITATTRALAQQCAGSAASALLLVDDGVAALTRGTRTSRASRAGLSSGRATTADGPDERAAVATPCSSQLPRCAVGPRHPRPRASAACTCSRPSTSRAPASPRPGDPPATGSSNRTAAEVGVDAVRRGPGRAPRPSRERRGAGCSAAIAR